MTAKAEGPSGEARSDEPTYQKILELEFIEEDCTLRAYVTDPEDTQGYRMELGSIVARIAYERLDLQERFEKLMHDAMAGVLVSMYGKQSNPHMVVDGKE